jgi:hypothetical protein
MFLGYPEGGVIVMALDQISKLDDYRDKKGEERRVYPRRDVSLRVDYIDTNGHAWLGLARNLSIGGMFLEYTPELSIGETITTAFVLPSGRPYRLRARVVHRTPAGAGLTFLHGEVNELTTKLDYLEQFCAA